MANSNAMTHAQVSGYIQYRKDVLLYTDQFLDRPSEATKAPLLLMLQSYLDAAKEGRLRVPNVAPSYLLKRMEQD